MVLPSYVVYIIGQLWSVMDCAATNSDECVAVAMVACILQYHSICVWLTRWRIPVIVHL